MAKKIHFFYQKFLLALLGIFGGGAAHGLACQAPYDECNLGEIKYVSCGTNKLQKQVCTSCTYWYDDVAQSRSYQRTAGNWFNDDTCKTYVSECSYTGQTTSESCADDVGVGERVRKCVAKSIAGTTYYFWGYAPCTYTSCTNANDVFEAGKCYCTTACNAGNGYGTMVAQLRTSSVCPTVLSSSSSSV